MQNLTYAEAVIGKRKDAENANKGNKPVKMVLKLDSLKEFPRLSLINQSLKQILTQVTRENHPNM